MANVFRRSLIQALACVAMTATLGQAHAQAGDTHLKFQLDWRFEGPAALFVHPEHKGYFKEQGLDVSVDAASGAGAIQRVASGTHDLGFADLAALMEFHTNNPDAPIKPVAVMMIYNTMPGAIFTLKKSGINSPAELTGKKIGAPLFDASRRAFPLFANAGGVGEVEWMTMEPSLRETMLVRGDLDAVTGYTFTTLMNLEMRGVARDDVVVMPYATNGVPFYGNVIIASPKLIQENPEALKKFLEVFAKSTKEVLAQPADAIASLKAKDGMVNSDMEVKRLNLTIETAINTPQAREEGFGQVRPERLQTMAEQVSKTYQTASPVAVEAVWNGTFLPSAQALDVLPQP